MNIRIKRVYDKPEKSDGIRILIDRLWPRGVSKQKAKIDFWIKEATPSNELRKWFHTDPEERWPEFKKRLKKQLRENESAIKSKFLQIKGRITLITAVKDVKHSHAPVVLEFLEMYVLK